MKGHTLVLSNPLSADLSAMRTLMLPGLINALASSLRSGGERLLAYLNWAGYSADLNQTRGKK